MKWFRHNTNASNNSKIRKLILRHGAEGYAVYFHCLELIAGDISKEKITFELEHDSEVIADNLKIKPESGISAIDKVNTIMNYILELSLFESDSNKIFCFKLASILDNAYVKNPQLKEIQDKIRENPGKSGKDQEKSCQTRLDETRLDEIRLDEIKLEEKKSKKIKKEKEEKEITPQLLPELAMTTTQHFYNQIIINSNPITWQNSPPKLNKWAEDIEKLNRIDKIDYAIIKDVIDFATKDTFWAKNILSGSKLRLKFNQLHLQMKGDKTKPYSQTPEEIQEYWDRIEKNIDEKRSEL